MQGNRFLMEFINMRKALNQSPAIPTIHEASRAGLKSGNVGTTSLISNKRSSTVVPAPVPVMDDDITYKKIIEDKPPKPDVLEYFRKRIEELKEV